MSEEPEISVHVLSKVEQLEHICGMIKNAIDFIQANEKRDFVIVSLTNVQFYIGNILSELKATQ